MARRLSSSTGSADPRSPPPPGTGSPPPPVPRGGRRLTPGSPPSPTSEARPPAGLSGVEGRHQVLRLLATRRVADEALGERRCPSARAAPPGVHAAERRRFGHQLARRSRARRTLGLK